MTSRYLDCLLYKLRFVVPFILFFLLNAISAHAMFEDIFLYFPDPKLRVTPAVASLPYQDIDFTTIDGIRLHGWYVMGDEGKPPVLFCHGNAGNISDRIEILAFLHSMGLPVFIFDYRGYGRSTGQASEEGMYQDVRAALAWLEKRGWAAHKVIYLGRSLGASVALQLALEKPPAALVLECPFTSVAAMGRMHHPILFRLFGRLLKAKYNNLEKMSLLRAPLVVIHGEADDIVPCKMGEMLFTRAPHPKHLLLLPGLDHNALFFSGSSSYREIWRSLADGRMPD